MTAQRNIMWRSKFTALFSKVFFLKKNAGYLIPILNMKNT